jgi:hypothetical protein
MKYDCHRSKASSAATAAIAAISPMAMGTATLLTATDLLDVPGPDLPHELWRGVLHAVTPASWEHGMIVGRLDPALRTVRIHGAAGELLLGEDDILDGGEVLPGFRHPIAKLFAGLPR